jgi:micrococcal nuclease
VAEPRASRLAALATAVMAVVLVGCTSGSPVGATPPAERETGHVVRVSDGDTLTVQLADRRERVRLIGVDSPELHASPKLDRDAARSRRSRRDIQAEGARAQAFAEKRLLGRTVALERDIQARDRYGRLLAYVWLEDGTLFNLELVREGWARILTKPPNVRHAADLLDAQRDARDARRGLWAEPTSPRRPAQPSRRSAASTSAAPCSTSRSAGASAAAASAPRRSRRVRSTASMNAR